MVTVASRCMRSIAKGTPTMLLRPTTQTLAPLTSTPERSRSSRHPRGVQATLKPLADAPELDPPEPVTSQQGSWPGVPAPFNPVVFLCVWVVASAARFRGCSPSTSLRTETASSTACSSICDGNGSWTKMPCTRLSLFNLSINSSNSACEQLAGRLTP